MSHLSYQLLVVLLAATGGHKHIGNTVSHQQFTAAGSERRNIGLRGVIPNLSLNKRET
jgi:hypothetical protein